MAVYALFMVYLYRLRRDLHKIRPSHKLQKIDLNIPSLSAWQRIRDTRSERGYIVYTTFTL